MIFDMNRQVTLLLFSIASGILIGILFDIYRVIRGEERPGNIVTAIEDILFWILTGVLVFIFMMYTNYAFLSFNIFVYIAIGLVLYFSILSKYFINVFSVFLGVFLLITRTVIYYISYPLRVIFYNLLKKRDKKI